jgi:hypothetical protein
MTTPETQAIENHEPDLADFFRGVRELKSRPEANGEELAAAVQGFVRDFLDVRVDETMAGVIAKNMGWEPGVYPVIQVRLIDDETTGMQVNLRLNADKGRELLILERSVSGMQYRFRLNFNSQALVAGGEMTHWVRRPDGSGEMMLVGDAIFGLKPVEEPDGLEGESEVDVPLVVKSVSGTLSEMMLKEVNIDKSVEAMMSPKSGEFTFSLETALSTDLG